MSFKKIFNLKNIILILILPIIIATTFSLYCHYVLDNSWALNNTSNECSLFIGNNIHNCGSSTGCCSGTRTFLIKLSFIIPYLTSLLSIFITIIISQYKKKK